MAMELKAPGGSPVEGSWTLGPLAYSPLRAWWLWASLLLLSFVGYELKPRLGLDLMLAVVFLYLIAFAYRCIYNRSVTLYMDDAGVWVNRGVVPWNRGVVGVKWRDIESVVYQQGLANWLSRSFPVTVVERFTQGGEMHIEHVWHGDEAVSQMNAKLMVMTKGTA